MTDGLLRRVRAATLTGWRGEAAVHPGGEVAEMDGLLCSTTAIPVREWNGVHVIRPPAEPVAALRAAMDWFAARGVAYGVLVPVEYEPPLAAACGRVGLRLVKVQRQMAVHLADFRPVPIPPELDIRVATGPAEVVGLAQECFGDPPAEATRFVAPTIGHPDWTLLVGYVGGEPATTVTLMRQGPDGLGVYGVATTAAYRRRGYGGAITTAALQRGFATLTGVPAPFAQLNPSETAEGMYGRLGFRTLPGWAVWLPAA